MPATDAEARAGPGRPRCRDWRRIALVAQDPVHVWTNSP